MKYKVNTHGMSNEPIFKLWWAIQDRCYNKNTRDYYKYGGKGITVCPRWRASFETFYSEMGDVPEGCSLDRVDNNAGYSQENCRWATRAQQSRNTSRNRWYTIEGKMQCVADWCDELGIKRTTMATRRHRGWSEQRLQRALEIAYSEVYGG